MRYPHQKVLPWPIVLFLATASSFCHVKGQVKQAKESRADRLDGLFDRSRTVLTSQEEYGAVHIPFTLRDNIIYLKMVWAGRPVEAILDTGSAFVARPQSLHLVGARTGISQEGVMAASVTTDGEWTVLSSMKAGGCEWQNIPTVAAGEMRLTAPPESRRTDLKTVAPPAPLLGASAFRKLILTVDYRRMEIIIRSPAYDISRLPLRPQDLLLTPEWLNNYLPVLHGSLGGQPARLGLDTACAGMPIDSRFAGRLPESFRAGTTSMNINGVQVGVPRLKPLPGVLAGQQFIDSDPPTFPIPADVDALVGTGFLQNYRVTFDYARSRILLEPYSGGRR